MNIRLATSFEECVAFMDPCGEGDLVLWDVNNVLFAYESRLFRPANTVLREEWLVKVRKKYQSDHFWEAYTRFQETTAFLPVEPTLPAVLRRVRQSGAVTGVLSSAMGPAYAQKRTVAVRREQLKMLGQFDPVLFAGMREKGERLQTYFLACSKLPQRLVFIDDIALNVRDVGQLAQSLSIPYIGIHFRSTLLHQESALSFAELEPEMRAFEALFT